MRSCSAASTITRCSIWSSASAARPSSCASSSTWTSATATTGSPSWSCRRANCGAHPCALADAAALGRITAARSRSACASTTARARSASSHRSRSRSAATAPARACPRRASSIPACSPTGGLDLRAPLRAGASDAELLQLIRGVVARPQRSLQRAARGIAPQRPRRKKIEMNYIGG